MSPDLDSYACQYLVHGVRNSFLTLKVSVVRREEPMTLCFVRIHILLREGEGFLVERPVICKGVQLSHGSWESL